MTTEQLKPCAHCGAQPQLKDLAGWEIHCDCGISMCLWGPEKEPLIAAWNRRTPVEQLSAQTAEPVAWGNMADDIHDHDRVLITDKELARKYGEQCYTLVPLYTHPAKTEQPSLSDAQIIKIAESLPCRPDQDRPSWGLGYRHDEAGEWRIPHVPSNLIPFARALLSAQCQDSNKDAERYRWLRDRLSAADFCYSDPPRPVLVFDWPANVGVGGNCDRNIDAAIANGAQT